jgi:ABC-type bacteriocin/lantibiotic exporter with double-glycine peptidase domain
MKLLEVKLKRIKNLMLPLKLSITGLYSYQKKQTIDFEELTNAGLFGIFGAVGSGKSSVLKPLVLFYTVIQSV